MGQGQEVALRKPERLVSLDAFRGLTIAGMILVNNPGSWSSIYKPLGHATWDGWTPTDWIFPFFLFIVGVAMTFSFDKRLAKGANKLHLLAHVFCRASVLFLLGLILTGFPNFRLIMPFILGIVGLELLLEEPSHPGAAQKPAVSPVRTGIGVACMVLALVWFVIDFRYFNGPTPQSNFQHFFPLTSEGGKTAIRIPGVLQRIGLCYLAAALIMVGTGWRGRLGWTAGLIAGYWIIMRFVGAPAGYQIGNGLEGITVDPPADSPFRGALNDWIDVKLLGAHLYSHRPDPEGLLSTIPAIATTLFGALTGMFIQAPKLDKPAKAWIMVAAGVALLVVGAGMDLGFPINKKNWSSSYVVFMSGWALVILGACYYVIDVLGWRRWCVPFLVLGTNAIVAFFASGILARLMGMFKFASGDKVLNVKEWTYSFFTATFSGPKNASMAWALCYVGLWVILLIPLYWKRIFVKI